jgi:hypothetical protein
MFSGYYGGSLAHKRIGRTFEWIQKNGSKANELTVRFNLFFIATFENKCTGVGSYKYT